MENNGVVIPPVDPEVVVPAAPAAPQLDNSRPSQGPRRKTEKFWQIEKIIGDLYELDNFKRKIFFEKKISKLKWQMSFFDRF